MAGKEPFLRRFIPIARQPILKRYKKLPALGQYGEKTTDMKCLFEIPHARFEELLILHAGHVAADIGALALRVAHLAEHAAVR